MRYGIIVWGNSSTVKGYLLYKRKSLNYGWCQTKKFM
jgi:hypothetical protein